MALLIIYLVTINALAYSLMYIDKKRAIAHKYRISEKTLWTVSLLGGAAAAFAAMHICRHKTRHLAFKYGLPLLTVFHIIVLASL